MATFRGLATPDGFASVHFIFLVRGSFYFIDSEHIQLIFPVISDTFTVQKVRKAAQREVRPLLFNLQRRNVYGPHSSDILC